HHRPMIRPPPPPPAFPYTTLFRSRQAARPVVRLGAGARARRQPAVRLPLAGRSLLRLALAPALSHRRGDVVVRTDGPAEARDGRSEEHTSELQSRGHLVCRLLLEK